MKQFYILITLSLISFSLTGQTIDVINLSGPLSGMISNGNDIYIAENGANKISKIDTSLPTPTATDVITGLVDPVYELVLNGDDLYISTVNKIFKIDITDPVPTSIDVITGLSSPYGLAINGNDLYIGETGTDKISKIDITDPTPTLTDVVTGLNNPTDLLLNGNDLYIAENGGNKISKIDISSPTPTATDVVSTSIPLDLAIAGNYIFSVNFGGEISKTDITPPAPTPVNVLTGIGTLSGIVYIGNELYISENSANKITKINEFHGDTITITGTCSDPDVLGVYEYDRIYNGKASFYKGFNSTATCNDFNVQSPCETPKNRYLIRWDGSKWVWSKEIDFIFCQWFAPASQCIPGFGGGTPSNTTLATSTDNSESLPPCSNWIAEAGGCVPNITGCETLGFIQNMLSNNVTLYPNPTNGDITIDIGQINKSVTVSLISVTGQIIWEKNMQNTSSLEFKITQPAGFYFVLIVKDSGKDLLKVLKK